MTYANKGGVICVPSQLKPSNIQRFVATDIEALSTTIQLPNADYLQITIVYRSPCVPLATLTNLLTRLLTYVTLCTVRCVILDDFNEDVLYSQAQCQI